MTALIYFLIACNLAFPLAAAYRQCVSRAGVQINHIFMFTVGFWFYWIAPIVIGMNRQFDTDAQISGWSNFFNSISPEILVVYLVFTLGFYFCFYTGSILGSRIQFEFGSVLLEDTDKRGLESLARAIKTTSNPLSAYLVSLLPPFARSLWDAWNDRAPLEDSLGQALQTAINGWLQSGAPDDNARLDTLPLSPTTRMALAQSSSQDPTLPGQMRRCRIRRVVLQEAFPSAALPRLRLRSRWEPLRIHPNQLRPYLLFGLALAGVYALINRNDFFKGYTTNSVYENPGPRGAFVGTSLLLLALGLLYTLYYERVRPHLPFLRRLINPYIGAYLVVAVLVMSMGGRLYLVSGLCMLMIYATVYHRRFKARNFLLVFVSLSLFAGIVGAARMGAGLSLVAILTSVFAETIGTSISLIAFLAAGRMDLLNAPVLLASEFINLVPSALLPNKSQWMLSTTQMGFVVYNPQGAEHSAIQFLMNFGILGSMAVIFLAGLGMGQLKRSRVPLVKVIYIMIAGWMGFSIFRDSFGISIVKTILEFSILVPIFTVYSAWVLQNWLRPQAAAASRSASSMPFV